MSQQNQNRKIPLDYNLPKASEEELKKLLIKARSSLNQQKQYRVLFLEADKPVSVPQTKYYWVIVNKFCKDEGQDPKRFHEEMKNRFAMSMIEINGSPYEVKGSTTTMNTKEMTTFIDNVRQFILEFFNYQTPDPHNIPIDEYAKYFHR